MATGDSGPAQPRRLKAGKIRSDPFLYGAPGSPHRYGVDRDRVVRELAALADGDALDLLRSLGDQPKTLDELARAWALGRPVGQVRKAAERIGKAVLRLAEAGLVGRDADGIWHLTRRGADAWRTVRGML